MDADMKAVSFCDFEVPLHAGSSCSDMLQLFSMFSPCEHGFRPNLNSIVGVPTKQRMPLAALARRIARNRSTFEERWRCAV